MDFRMRLCIGQQSYEDIITEIYIYLFTQLYHVWMIDKRTEFVSDRDKKYLVHPAWVTVICKILQ